MLLANIVFADREGRPLSFSRNKHHDYRDITMERVVNGFATIVVAGLAPERRTKPGQR
jgi:hypothetical protein